ncbi:RNA-dependent RNA polymerase [Gouleako virus]|uniref:RNA-directed RNA polymerase L n=1 Tax=Gouleako virus TaxID=603003 RepID=G0Y279_9VIRU|nr:RNA-dependent RNA polymerase [Gouleako virus]AEJ38175.1 RNA-dependent RNA polymerase [Gouleako virus]
MEYINEITKNFNTECSLSGVLHQSEPKVFPQSRGLRIPDVEEDDLIVDIQNQTISVEWNGISDERSASSLAGPMSKKMSFNEFRSFPHDFTFEVISRNTDDLLSDFFPRVNDNFDNKTPDVISRTAETCLILEFTTTLANNKRAMLSRHEEKKFKYTDAIRRRITAMRENASDVKFGFYPIVISNTQALFSPVLGIPQAMINELCARFRFASSIVQMARDKGLTIEEDDVSQLKADIFNLMKTIKPKFQEDGDCLVPLTRERVLTTESTAEVRAFASDFYKKTLSESVSKVRKVVRTKKLQDLKFDLREKCLKPGVKLRLDEKTILQVPNCIPDYNEDWVIEKSFKTGPYTEFIDECIEATRTSEWNFELSKEEHIELAMREGSILDEKRTATDRRKYKRVRVRLTNEQRLEFAKLGVQGKSMKDNIEVQMHRESKSIPFDPEVLTDDIDDFLSSNMKEEMDDLPQNMMLSKTLLLQSALDHGSEDSDRAESAIKTVKKMDLLHWCSFLSDIGTELSISLKQNVLIDEFVVKKLPNWNAFIIIKPTNSSSHIFYCIVSSSKCKKATEDGISKTMLDGGNYKYTEWLSYNLAKLTNLVKAESFFIVMMSQWSRYYESTIEECRLQPSIFKMLKLCLLIHLEDKSRTEEIFTLFRYISMEKFSLTKVDNLKMLEKIPDVLWSRLQCWASKKLLQVMCDDTYVPKVEEEVSEAGVTKKERSWTNLINPYTRELLTHPKQLVELYYIGYATNKEAKAWENTEFQLIEKIIKYEMELDNARPEYCGLREEPNGEYRFHEWSRKMVCSSADTIKRYMKGLYSTSYNSKLNNSIVHRLHRLTWEQVSTLKASSTFDPSKGKEKDIEGKYTTKRIKVIVAVMRAKNMLRDTPVLTLVEVLKDLEEEGGLRVDIFKKNQHGGLREIYVLDLASRIVQLCLEEISRAVCQELPIEMMMHPELKLKKPQEHMYKAAISPESYKSNVSSSNDAKVWNQGHHVAKFAQFLCRLLSPEWHGLIVNGLKLWTNKKIALPDGVMNILSRANTPLFRNSIHQAVHDSYKGITPMRWLRPGETFMRIESGMMQGILHYTSSLFHASLLMMRDSLWRSYSEQLGVKSITTDLVSSDDSSRMTDIFYRDSKNFKRGKIFARADHMAIEPLSRCFGIWMSPKSTYCCNGIMEFNSEYFFRASLYRPTLKWSYACLGIVEVESLVERQEVMYNLITELLEGGSGFRQAFECNIAMGFLHYRLMGITVNPLAADYFIRLSGMPDPTLGYFLVDCCLGAGLPGFSYNLWKRVKRYPTLSGLYQQLMVQGKMTTTTTGQITRGVQTRFGNRQKVMKIMDECEESVPNWREDVEETPQILYSVPRTLQNSLIKIMVKLTSPSVTRALSKGNSVARMLASAIYLISGFSTTIGSNWNAIVLEKENKDVRKTSLWRILNLDVICEGGLGEAQERALFPQKDFFISLEQTLSTISQYSLAPFGSKKMLRSHIQVFPEGATLPFPLERMVRWKWFSEPLPASTSILEIVWAEYKTIYPWLSETPQETLHHENSHFETHIQLRNFIARQETRGRLVHLTGAPIRDSKTRDVLLECLLKNQVPGHTLVEPSGLIRREAPREIELYSHIASIVNFPLKSSIKRDRIMETLYGAQDLWDGSDMRASSRRTKLGVIQKYIKLTGLGQNKTLKLTDRPQFLTYIERSRHGVIGGFKKIQVKRPGTEAKQNLWDGDAEWIGSVGNVSVSIRLRDEKLRSITTSSISKLRESESLLTNLLKEFGVNSIDTTSRIFGAIVFFDLSTFRTDGQGCPVVELPDLKYSLGTQKDNFRIAVTPTHIRLQQTEDGKKFFTIIAHQIRTSDFVFNKKIDQPSYLLRPWINNESEKVGTLTSILDKIMEGGETKSVDTVEFKQFVKDGLIPSMARSGWRFHQASRIIPSEMLDLNDDLSLMAIPLNLDEASTGFELEDIDFFGGMDDEADGFSDDELSQDFDMSFDVHDAILGEFDATPFRGVSGNIRSVHRYWDEFSSTQFRELSRRSKDHLETGYSDSENQKLSSWLSYFLGWEFQPFKFEVGVLESSLQAVEEV